MWTRRGWLLAPLAAFAQLQRPRVSVVWTESGIPEAFAREAVLFPRAYTSCPDRAEARWALEHGRFPHTTGANDSSLWDQFQHGDDITVMTTFSADGKDSPFDRSIRVPLAIRWPARLAPRVANEVLASHVDILPTLLSLVGLAHPASLQGRDLQGDTLPEAVYSEGGLGTREEWRALVRGFDKITWNLRDEVTGLYNLADDPGEQTDLREHRDYRITLDSMFALAHQWMDRLQDGRDAHGLRTRRPL